MEAVPETEEATGASRPLSMNMLMSRSANELSSFNHDIHINYDHSYESDEDNNSTIPRCRSLDTHSNVFDRGKHAIALRRSNSMNNASGTSTLKSNVDLNISGMDSDFDVEDENGPWSAKFNKKDKECQTVVTSLDMKRQDIIAEFIHTEKTYLRNLLLLQKAYEEPLSHIITANVAKRIFFNLSSLVELHRSFKKELVLLQSSTEYVECIGSSVANFFSRPPFQEEMVKYCINLTDSLMVLKESMRTPDFAAFLIECESNPLCRRKHLKELLPNPMQRVTKYPLLLQQIQKYTEPDSIEFDTLTECLNSIKDICNNINSAVARADSMRIEKAARARLLAEDVNREVGEVILNIPAFCDDIKVDVNIVLFERYIVLFPNNCLSLYASSSASSDTHIEQSIRIIAVDEEDVVICPDKQEVKSFYLISKALPLICPIICRSEEECQLISQTLERAKNKEEGDKPVMKLLDLEVAEANERNRPPSIPSSSTEEEDKLCFPGQLQQRSREFDSSDPDSPGSTIQERLNKADTQIFTLLTYKLGIMQELYGCRKLPARDLPCALSQLTCDANTLHDVAQELLDSYRGSDKDDKLLKIRSSFRSLVANVDCIAASAGSGGEELPEEGITKMRRASMMFDRMLPWKREGEGGEVTRRSNKKYSRSRANTNSPSLKLSPKSSTESLNKVSCNRLSSCSHHSTDSELDCQVDGCKSRPVPRNLPKTAARGNRNSTFDFFRRSVAVSAEERPVITAPVLQHTTNKSIAPDNG